MSHDSMRHLRMPNAKWEWHRLAIKHELGILKIISMLIQDVTTSHCQIAVKKCINVLNLANSFYFCKKMKMYEQVSTHIGYYFRISTYV